MGSIQQYETKKGIRYRVQYVDPQGHHRTKAGFTKKALAKKWEVENAQFLNTDDWINPNAGNVKVEALAETWLASHVNLKPSTRELNRQVWESTVKPQWGNHRTQDVKHSSVQQWISTMDKSPSWIRHAHSALAQILDIGVRDRVIRRNPARNIRLPRRSRARKVYLTMEQLQLFAHECGDRKDLILLLGTSGLRWGEAIALRPCDLDFAKNRILVTRNAAKVGNGIELGTPKTHEARSVAVASAVMGMLAERSKALSSTELLWRGKRGGWLRSPGHNTWFDGALKRAQVKDPSIPRFTPHGLRHIAAGLLVESGANVKAVQRQLGHASAVMTLDQYAELFDDGLDVIAGTLDSNFLAVSRKLVD